MFPHIRVCGCEFDVHIVSLFSNNLSFWDDITNVVLKPGLISGSCLKPGSISGSCV